MSASRHESQCTTQALDAAACSATIDGAFRCQSAAAPDAVALVWSGGSVSYSELDRRSDQFAQFLRMRGVLKGARVATLLDRSAEAVVALLGILKAGAAFVPLDPRAPPQRRDGMLADCMPALVLTREGCGHAPQAAPPTWPTADLDLVADEVARQPAAPFEDGSRPDSLAYVMYTSGSTGRPKGVMVPHRAVTGLVLDNPFADFGPSETFLSLAPLTFDASTFEIWGALLNGGRLAILPEPAPSLSDIEAAISSHGVTTLWLTAGLFHLMVDEAIDALRPLRQLLAGGDVLSRPHVDRALRELPTCRLINGYGPTEATTFACCYTVTQHGLGTGAVPIGTPIARTEVHILDDAMRPVQDGSPGELYVGGEGLADGYLNLPDATARSFVANPFDVAEGARLYRTGDLVRKREDGNLQFIGRADRQVKVNGHRVELDAVELAIRSIDGVADAAVVARDQCAAGTRIDGFLVLANRSGTTEAAVRAAMRAALPAPMLPASAIVLDRFPLTRNGKVDRGALSRIPAQSGRAHAAPAPTQQTSADQTERMLRDIWSAALGVPVSDVDTNFFDLGGTSLELMRVHAAVAREIDPRISIMLLFRFPTIRGLARHIHGNGAPDDRVSEPANSRNAIDRSAKYRQRMRDARSGGTSSGSMGTGSSK